jgi:hypothetical protein
VESDGFAVSAFWRVRTEGLTRSVQSVAGRDQTQQPSRFLRVSCAFLWLRPPGGDCKDRGGRGGGRGRTHWRGGETGCLPERCRAPQGGETPLHHAAEGGHAAVVEQLLAAGGAADATGKVRGKWGADRGGRGGRTKLCVSS